MQSAYAGFLDYGFLRAEGAKMLGERRSGINPVATEIANWFRQLGTRELQDLTFLRTYWYDGAFDPSHPNYEDQRHFFRSIAQTPGLQLRLGHIAERSSHLEVPIRRALRNTATGLGLAPQDLLAEFSRHWKFRPERRQKGVDTRVALDMVRMAGLEVCSAAVLVAGDRDLAEAVQAAQDFGMRVLIATPNRQSVARELSELADDVIDIDRQDLAKMLEPPPAANPGGQ